MPEPGDIQLIAPEGEIDAGEAGIAGKNVILAATKVLNVQNIDVAAASVGVPETTPAASIGALAGAGSVSETSKVAEESSAMKAANERMTQYFSELSDALVSKWLSVEVIGFGTKEEDEERERQSQ